MVNRSTTYPRIADIADPVRMPILASSIKSSLPGNANPPMKSDIVKPIPHRIETPQISVQLAFSGRAAKPIFSQIQMVEKMPNCLPTTRPAAIA